MPTPGARSFRRPSQHPRAGQGVDEGLGGDTGVDAARVGVVKAEELLDVLAALGIVVLRRRNATSEPTGVSRR